MSCRNLIDDDDVAVEAYVAGLQARDEIEKRTKVNISLREIAEQHGLVPRPNPAANAFSRAADDNLRAALSSAHAPRTTRNQTSAINRFVTFVNACDPDATVFPASCDMVLRFIANGIGQTGPDKARNDLAALASFHQAYGLPFERPPQTRLILNALRTQWPGARGPKQSKDRKPITPAMMRALDDGLNPAEPLHAAVLACARAAWCGQLRLGEIMPENASETDFKRLPTRDHWELFEDYPIASRLYLPWTKTTKFRGVSITLAPQDHQYDATSAIQKHLRLSPLARSRLLCEYVDSAGTRKILDKKVFMQTCNSLWSQAGCPRITGHSFRIGGTTAYLVAGVDPSIVKKMGRWSSDAFLRYWRNTSHIVAKFATNVEFVDVEE